MPRTRGGTLWRALLAALLVIAGTTAATAVAGLLQFKQIAHEIAATPALKSVPVTIANPGQAQTLLLIGSDHRAGTPWTDANTDTMMLVRIDPNSSTINLLSVPRDLEVQLPQGGYTGSAKLNAAYSIGGPKLLLQTMRNQVFPGLKVNHIIDINFGGFEDLVNAIGCVYTDVDHRYYNNTAYTDYSSIDIQPGYQRLCGTDALAFVRFRHTDSDIVRNARQQDFLRWVKDQFTESDLISQKDQLISIFGKHTQTDNDLHSIDGLINLFNVVAFSAGHTIKQVPFPAIFLPCNTGSTTTATGQTIASSPCYVSANSGAEQAAYRSFMAVTPAAHKSAGSAAGSQPVAHHPPGPAPAAAVTSGVPGGQGQAAALGKIGMPVYYPKVIADGSQYCTNSSCTIGPGATPYPRAYQVQDQGNNNHIAYRMTLVLNPALGQYYGVQGTTWQHPPILNSPNEIRTVAGKTLMLYINQGKISLAAWRTPQGVYWISNDLTDDLSNQQMLAIAASFTKA